jgi:hypothetical protein
LKAEKLASHSHDHIDHSSICGLFGDVDGKRPGGRRFPSELMLWIGQSTKPTGRHVTDNFRVSGDSGSIHMANIERGMDHADTRRNGSTAQKRIIEGDSPTRINRSTFDIPL